MAMFSRCAPRERAPRDEMREVLRRKAHDLFALCDEGAKGFASKRDMYKLTSELSLSPEQLDEVFDALDRDKNGCLTIDEFTEGLGMFLGVDCHLFPDDMACLEQMQTRRASTKQEQEEEDEQFDDFLDQLGANNLFKDEDYIRHMWNRVKQDDPSMLENFERFLGKITQELRNTKNDYSSLESALRSRSIDHEEQVQALYTEMEDQLQSEMEALLAKEKSKEQKIRNELETELQHKDKQLHELITEHVEMEKQLEELNTLDVETRHQNSKLQKERDELAMSLLASEKMLKDMQARLEQLRKRSIEEKRKRAKAAFKVSENIALEREGLVKQLQDLKKVNKQLIDEKDELLLSATTTPMSVSDEESLPAAEILDGSLFESSCAGKILNSDSSPRPAGLPPPAPPRLKREPALGDPLRERASSMEGEEDRLLQPASTESENLSKSEEECEVDDQFFVSDPKFLGLPEKDRLLLQNNLNVFTGKDALTSSNKYAENKGNITEPNETKRFSVEKQHRSSMQITNNQNSSREVSARSPRLSRKHETENEREALISPPERVFKIVLIGDSGVGKTSIVQRFCSDAFKATFNATVGVDFQVQTVNVEGRSVVLQLWDTAGQERFRSITQQYYRKADGIVVVYDVTSETSFKNVRNWMVHVQDNADDNVVIMIIGNKIDLCDSDENRVVKTKHGSKLADEYGTLFYETSAKSGASVEEAMAALACLLQEKEDEIMDKVLRLQEDGKSKKKVMLLTPNSH